MNALGRFKYGLSLEAREGKLGPKLAYWISREEVLGN